jgi:hypothetical protein
MTREETIRYLTHCVISEAGKAEEYLWRAMDARSLAEEEKWFYRAQYAEACVQASKDRLREIRGW